MSTISSQLKILFHSFECKNISLSTLLTSFKTLSSSQHFMFLNSKYTCCWVCSSVLEGQQGKGEASELDVERLLEGG